MISQWIVILSKHGLHWYHQVRQIMKSKPVVLVGFIAVLMTVMGWILLRLKSGRMISLPDRVRVG